MEDTQGEFPGLEIEYHLPQRVNYSLRTLSDFCRGDPDCVLIFYGGEPLLCTKDIRLIMDNVEPKHFMIQTNGLQLHNLEASYVNRFHTILVSIDGDEASTDLNRGRGTFRKVMDNLRAILGNGFRGELIARMTVMEPMDVYRQVRWLLENDSVTFSSVHWQLNAGFWDDFSRRTFKRWSEETYNTGIRKLVDFWTSRMEETGTVLKIYPFLGIMHSLLYEESQSRPRCGAGWINYTIQTDGHITPCPAMWGMKDYYVGHISRDYPLSLKKCSLSEPCLDCDILSTCGGRCLYANITRRWSPEAYSLVCNTVRNLKDALEKKVPTICKIIDGGKISMDDFSLTKYNGCEIVP